MERFLQASVPLGTPAAGLRLPQLTANDQDVYAMNPPSLTALPPGRPLSTSLPRVGLRIRPWCWFALVGASHLAMGWTEDTVPGAVTWPKTFPVLSNVQYTFNTCKDWRATGQLVATPFAASTMAAWPWHYRQYLAYPSSQGSLGHEHTAADGQVWVSGGNSATQTFQSDQPAAKAREINKRLYGVEDPAPGMRVAVWSSHGGGCAADVGRKECWGVFVFNTPQQPGNQYAVLPAGTCAVVPIPPTSCQFGTNAMTIDHGTIAVGRPSRASVDTTVTCTPAATKYTIRAQFKEPAQLTINGQPPKDGVYQFVSQGPHTLTITSDITPTQAGTFKQSGVLVVSVD